MASITTFFGTQGGGGSVSGTATRVAFFGGTPGNPSTTLDDSEELVWDDSNNRLSVGFPGTVGSTLTISGNGASDATSSLEVRTNPAYGDLLLFRVYNNGRIDSRMLDSSEALTDNVAIGLNAGAAITTGDNNTVLGADACALLTSGNQNTAVGDGALRNITSRSGNVAVGADAGRYAGISTDINERSINSIYIGANSRAFDFGLTVTNETVIGHSAVGNGDNTVTIGNSSVTDVYVNGNIVIQDKNIVLSDSVGTKIGTTASQKLAIWGKTPIVQPTTAGGSATVASPGGGNTIKTDDTFDGYTLAQVVRALRNIGVLA